MRAQRDAVHVLQALLAAYSLDLLSSSLRMHGEGGDLKVKWLTQEQHGEDASVSAAAKAARALRFQ